MESAVGYGTVPSFAASQNYLVHVWQTDDGLPQNWVSSIAQTSDGYIWIGTRYGGLARFDGIHFEPFNPQNTRALRDVQVEHLSVDAMRRLWVFMGNESISTFQDGEFHLHREPRAQPRIKLDHVLAAKPGEVIFAAEQPYIVKADISAENTKWTVFDSDRMRDVDQRTFSTDRHGMIWALTNNKTIVRFTGDRFEELPGTFVLPESTVVAIATDSAGRIWAATPRHLMLWEDGRGFIDVTPSSGERPESIVQIACSGDNGVWVLEKSRLRKFLNGRWQTETNEDELLQHSATGTFKLYGDAQGNAWLVSYGRGLWHLKSDGSVAQFNEQTGLPSVFITCWFQDAEENVWIGTAGGGVARIRESIFNTLGRAQGLPGKVVSSVCMDNEGKLWVGTMIGGLASWAGGRFETHQLPAPGEGNPAASLTVFPGHDGDVWVGSLNHGLMQLRDGKMRVHRNWTDIRVLFGDSRGNTWIGPLAGLNCIRDGRITQLGSKEGFDSSHAVGAMAEDSAGNIWIGTGPGDLWKYSDGKFKKYTPPPEWSAGRISALLPDADGVIWIGTLGGGLLRFHDGKFTRCTMANGLPDNNVSQLLDSGDGQIWAGTYAGIFRAIKDELTNVAAGHADHANVRIYGKFDGLAALECSSGFQPACWRGKDGTLYFSTADGVASVNPRKVIENKIAPTVIIEGLVVDGERRDIPPQSLRKPEKGKHSPIIKIAPGQHHVQFQITGLNFSAPDGVRFRVKLEGAETEWRNVNSRRLIGYGTLLPGKYRFRVIACNNDGIWNMAGDSLDIEVLPYFWETLWFKAGLIIIVFAILAGIGALTQRQRYRRRLQESERQREMERERTRIAQDLHDDLGTSLTQISMLGALASRGLVPPAESMELIQQMDGCARKMVTALDEIVWAVDPQNDSWYELANYLGFFAEEFFRPTEIRCRLDIQSQVPPHPLLSEVRHHLFLAVKEALNNVARHSGAAQVCLRINIHDMQAVICVEDDGCGFSREADSFRPTGNGLNNMRRRMEHVGGTVEIQSGTGGRGTLIVFQVPLIPIPKN